MISGFLGYTIVLSGLARFFADLNVQHAKIRSGYSQNLQISANRRFWHLREEISPRKCRSQANSSKRYKERERDSSKNGYCGARL